MLRVALCGGVVIESDGRRLPETLLAGRQGRLVLAYLVCERHRSVPREELADLVWGERLPSSWATSISAVVSKLRKLFGEAGLDGPTALASAFGSYRVHLPEDAWVDWDAAVAALAAAERAVGSGDAASALAEARVAEEIARRGFLTDDSPWVDGQRERLRDIHVRALQAKTEAHLVAGEPARAAESAREALALDELRETTYRLLMRALVASGERGEALRVWERCRILLVEELGTDPAPETEAVYLSILGDAAPQSPGADATLPTGVVTFLLTDIVESSVLWERNPEAMAGALERHDHLVADVARAHGGVLLKSKLEGDATVSVFRRASAGALAALELQASMQVEAWPAGATPTVRMALHTGEAIERDGDYFGPALNRAARLRSLARGGQILVSQAVAEVVRDHLPDDARLRSLGEFQLRGLTRGEHVFELGTGSPEESGTPVAEAPSIELLPLPAPLSSEEPFVGRDAEFQRLATDWATATAGVARATFIAGEPGVGKTRLAAEWARRAHDQGALVLYGRCDEGLGAPYQPFSEALRVLVPHLGADRLSTIRGVEALSRLVPELVDIVPDLPTPSQADPDTERYLLFDALARVLAAVSSQRPVLIVVDDLHWAAKPTLLMLRHLLRSGDGSRVQIVGTYRSTDLDRTHPLADMLADLHRDGTADRLNLSGLDSNEVNTYLSAAGYDDVQLGRVLSTVTSGNPFFLIEVLRHVDESGGVWDPSTLPQGVREAVGRRVSRLSDQANEALLVASVVGSQFSLELVERVLERDLVDAVDEATQAGLVVEDHGNDFRFNHALVRQSLLNEIGSVKRIRLHQRIAAALEGESAVPTDSQLADLAHHYFECAFAEGAAKAVDYSRRAGERAMARLAYEEASDLFDQALQAADVETSGATDDDRGELLLARCEALLAAGEPTAAIDVVADLERAGRNSPRLSAWARCFAGQLAVLTRPERLAHTAADLAEAARDFAELSDDEGEAKAHTVRSSCLARLGRIAECETALDQALTAGRRAGNPRRVNAVLAGAPVAAMWGPSPVARASGRCLDVVRVLRITTGSPAVEAIALRCQAVLEALRGRTDAARRMLGSARRSLEGLGHTHGLLETDLFAGLVELTAGAAADAELVLRRAYDGFVARGVSVDAAQAAALLARAVLAQGRVDEAIALTQDSERLAGGDLQAGIAWRAARAEALAQQGRTADALAAATDAVALADPTDALIHQADAHLALAVVLRAAGDDHAAEREAHRAIERYDRKGATSRVEAVRALVHEPAATGAPTTEAPSRRRVRTNRGIAVLARGAGRWGSHSLDEWAARIADDYVEVDHRTQITTDRGGYLRTLSMWALMDDFEVTVEPLASLGERHGLVRRTARMEGTPLGPEHSGPVGAAEIVVLEVGRTNEEGQLVHCERFDGDDGGMAVARLIEMHAEDELPAERLAGRQRMADYIRDATPFQWSEDAILVDNRMAGLGTLRGPDEIRSAGRALRDVAGDIRRRMTDVLGSSERVFLFDVTNEGTTASGDPFELSMLAMGEFDDDGRQRRVEWFDATQIDEALARFDEWTGARSVAAPRRRVRPNAASALLGGGPVDDEHLAAWAAEIADDLTGLDHRMHLPMNRDGCIHGLRSMAGEYATIETTPLATIGDRHSLVRSCWRSQLPAAPSTAPGSAEVEWLSVARANASGQALHIELFNTDDLHLALARLFEIYADGEAEPDQRERFYSAAKMIRNQNTLWAEDAVLVDHRRAGLGTLNGRGAIAAAAGALREVAADQQRRIVDILGATERVTLLEMVTVGNVDAGGPFEMTVLSLNVVDDDGLCSRQEWFSPDQIDDALARFDELAASPRTEIPANRAVAALDRLYEALLQGQWDVFAVRQHEDAILHDRRAIVGHRAEGREECVAYARSVFKSGVTAIDRSLVATRGETCVLRRECYRGPRGETHVLALAEITADDVIRRSCVFDPNELDAAVADLDTWYLEGEGSIAADALVPMFEFRKDRLAEDWDRVRALLDDRCEIVDHRPAPAVYGSLQGPDEFVAALRSLFEVASDIRTQALTVDAVGRGAAHLRMRTTTSTGDGEATEIIFHLVCTGDGDRLTRLEFFAIDDVDGARARLEQLSQPARATDGPSNGATARLAQQMDAFCRRNWDAFGRGLTDDAFHDDRRPLVGGVRHDGRDEVVKGWQSIANVGVTAVALTPLAVRGERNALVGALASGPTAEVEVVLWVEVDENNMYVGGCTFDLGDLSLAFAQLDAAFAAQLPREHAEAWRLTASIPDLYNKRDFDGLRDLFAGNAAILDERVTGWGLLTREALLDRLRELVDMAPQAFLACVRVRETAAHGVAAEFQVRGMVPGGGEFEISFECVTVVVDGKLSRLDLLPPGHADEAVRRLRLGHA